MDLPTIVESQKTIDNKTFYKTADICQILICKEGDDFENEEASPNKRKKDPHKVDKKYLWPHGVGPPLKNCRKRRFRKTRKKKYVEAPEIEKEVRNTVLRKRKNNYVCRFLFLNVWRLVSDTRVPVIQVDSVCNSSVTSSLNNFT